MRQTFGRHGFDSPKSKAGRRTVPLTGGLVAELRRHKLSQAPNPDGLVFASAAGTPIDPDNAKRAWARTLRKAGLQHVAFHSTRHTAVSLLIAHEQLNPKQLQAIVGHASIQLTYDTYGHLLPDAFDGLGAGLDHALGGDTGVTDDTDAASGAQPGSHRPFWRLWTRPRTSKTPSFWRGFRSCAREDSNL